MNKQQLQQLREMLEEDFAKLQVHLDDEVSVEDLELSPIDNHPADSATDLTTMTTEIALEEVREEQMKKVQAALKAMEDGTYGKCIECGKPIPFERLEVMPTALTCIDHVVEEQ